VTLHTHSPFYWTSAAVPAPLPVRAPLPVPPATAAPCDRRPPSVISDAALPRPQGIFKAGLWPHPLPYSLYDPAGISKKRTPEAKVPNTHLYAYAYMQ
jgi:hypothetical protein